MELGIHFVNFTIPGEPQSLQQTLADTARLAEDGGCSTFTLMDHFFQLEGYRTAEEPMLEAYTGLGFLAGLTTRMDLGLLVTGVTYRHPGLLAKTVTTLDVLSGGRAMLGIGAAWYGREHRALGVPFPPVAERFERLGETLQICRQMWSDNYGPYHGRHYQLAETMNHPKPVRQPSPPIVIGGGGERKTLRLVAQYADAWNLYTTDAAQMRHKLDVLKRHCDAIGRDPESIRRTVLYAADAARDIDSFLTDMEQFAALGVDLVSVMPEADPVSDVDRLVEQALPRLAELG